MKRVLSLVLVLCMVLTLASFPATAATANPKRVKIFTMGDSFTAGVIEPNAYRYYIYENLIKDGAVFEFIGKETSGDIRVTSLYNKHGGVGGAVIGHSEDVKWNGSSWATSSWEYTNTETGKTIKYSGTKNSIWYRLFAGSDGSSDYTKTEYGKYVKEADIVTLYIGLNDYYSSGTNGLSADIEHVKQRYITVVKRIFEINPEVSLYITTLNEVGGLRGYGLNPGDAGYENSLYVYNDFILNFTTYLAGDAQLAPYLDQITSVSLNQEGYKMGAGDSPSDDGHPNNKGDRKIGTQIYMAIKDEVLALNEQEGETYNPTRITSVTLDKTSLTLKTGENATVTSAIAPTNAEIISVIFSSSNESVATIDDYGRITAVGAGTATIYATALDSLRPGATKIEATCDVTVTTEQHTNVGDNFLPVVVENFSTTSAWTGSTELIATASKAYKHTTSNASSQITSKRTYDLKEGFSMSFKAALMGSHTKEVNASNKSAYYTSLKVGKYELRVSVNGKAIGFYYEGELVDEKIFAVAPVRQNDDKYTLTKYQDKVYVYRNNELLFTSDVNKYDTAEGNVVLKVVGNANKNIRDLEIKSIYGLKEITPTIKYSSTVTTSSGVDYPATNAIDGQLNTRYSVFAWKGADAVAWDSASNYLILDLGGEYDVSDLNIYWGGHPSGTWGATMPDAYNVSYSADNVTYTPALSYSGIHAVLTGSATDTYTSDTTSFAINTPSWASAADRTTYSYGTVKEADLDWTGVRYIKIQMTSINRNPSISEIEVYTKAYLEGEEPEGTMANYTVKYVDTSGNEMAPQKTGSGFIGGKITEKAVEIEGYIPDAATKSILVAEGENVITFVYELVPEKLPLTGANVIAQSGFGWTNDGKIEGSADVLFDGEDATNTKGYFTHAYFSGAFSGTYYIELDLGAVYDISHIVIQGGASDWNYAHITNYAIYTAGEDHVYGTTPAGKQEHGSSITSANKVRTDTTEIKTNDVRYIKIQIVDASYRRPCLGEIEVYRSMEEIPEPTKTTYTVSYVDEEGNPIADVKTGTGNVGEEITETAVSVDGYVADNESETITLVDGINTITFTYTKKAGSTKLTITAIKDHNPQSGHTADMVVDGDEATFYATSGYLDGVQDASGSYKLKFELSETITLDSLELYWSGINWGYFPANKYKVWVSADNATYTEILYYENLCAGTDTYDGKIVYGGSVGSGNLKARVTETGLNVKDVKYIMVEMIGWKYRAALAEIYVTKAPETPGEQTVKPITLAPGAVSSTSTQADKPLANAVDGDKDTYYAANVYYNAITNTNNELIFDIGYVGTVKSLDLLWGTSAWGLTTPNAYKVSVSKDGTTWTEKKSYSGIYDITTGAASNTIAGADTTFGITTSQWAIDNGDANVNAYTQGNILERNLEWNDVRYIKVTVTSWQYRLALREATVSSVPNEDQKIISKGGQIRLANTNAEVSAGLRFGASVIKSLVGIDGTYVYSEDADVKFGMYMLPKSMLGDAATLTEYLAGGVQRALDVPAVNIYSQDDNFVTFTAVLIGIPTASYTTDVVAVPYAVRDGEYTFFEETIRSYSQVAQVARQTTYSDTAINKTSGAERDALIEIAYQLDAIIAGKEPETIPAVTASTPTWTTDFNGTLSGTSWSNCPEGARAGGSYWENDMTSFDANGNLVLSAKWNSSLNGGNGYLMTGAVRATSKKYGYGYYEAKVKFPNAHKGAWGAFWQMVGNVSSTSNGAADGVEIDFIESIGNDSGKCQSALHWDGYSTAHKSTSSTYYAHNLYDGNWHTIGCERSADGYKFYIDGRLMWSVGPDEVDPCSSTGYLKLTVEAATWAVGTEDYSVYAEYMSETYAEKTDIMVVDYVKVWEY